ncbi:TfoX/Sxy family protein [Sporomusa sp. KB1]|jgi:DNA transformation protein|uniref:TfoX/Sxy family protein n=1 Tax=Sporomusa sp. KB1 TaxID=943346 RepID=UPI0011A4CF05|nr:TfoX/Sxy family protein [Sporomusa sp. KB1]TWH51886.1 DNA transformation protein [Sporomusa sp. KB1]
MSKLSKLPNIGKILEANLLAVGIETPEQLREIGAKEAFRRIRLQRDPGACLHMLYGIQGAILGILDTLMPADTKLELKAFFHSLSKE